MVVATSSLLFQIVCTPDHSYIPNTQTTDPSRDNSVSEIMDRLRKHDVEATLANLNKLMITTNSKMETLDTKGLSDSAVRVLGRVESAMGKVEKSIDNLATKKISDDTVALLGELRGTNAELKKTLASPAFQKLPDDAA